MVCSRCTFKLSSRNKLAVHPVTALSSIIILHQAKRHALGAPRHCSNPSQSRMLRSALQQGLSSKTSRRERLGGFSTRWHGARQCETLLLRGDLSVLKPQARQQAPDQHGNGLSHRVIDYQLQSPPPPPPFPPGATSSS